MASFDLPNAVPPELRALQQSFDPGDYRDAIKRLTIDLFREHLGADVFDANVMGMAHLGTFDLVRRFIQADGLGMLRSDREDAATRYLYRAWKKADAQGRGLHFLRTYLQLLYPNEWEVHQLEQDKSRPYPEATLPARGRTTHFLTSRLDILIDANAKNAPLLGSFVPTISSVIPARFVPQFAVFRQADLPTYSGVGLGALGRSTPNLKLSETFSAKSELRVAIGAHGSGDMVRPVHRGVSRVTVGVFGHNDFARYPCPAVRVVSRATCLERAARDPNLSDAHQRVVKVQGGGPFSRLALVVTDRRIPTLGAWPRGSVPIPDRARDTLPVGGALVQQIRDPLPRLDHYVPPDPNTVIARITSTPSAALFAHNNAPRQTCPAVRFLTARTPCLEPWATESQQQSLLINARAPLMHGVCLTRATQLEGALVDIDARPAIGLVGHIVYPRVPRPAVRFLTATWSVDG